MIRLSKLSRPVLGFALAILVACSLPVWGQATPIPLPGGDLIPPFGLFNQFFPGGGSTYDGINADPHGITNFRGVSAMGFTNGTATDNNGKTYQVVTDIRVYQGDYVGAKSTFGGGGTTSEKSHGTFVEI